MTGNGLENALHRDREFENKLRAVYADRDVKCPRCRYQLRGAPGPRCPECGLVVSELLRVADTKGWGRQQARSRAVGSAMVKVAVLIAVLGACAIALTAGM